MAPRQSKRYHDLIRRIDQLEKHLLPSVKVHGNYTRKESDFIRSYVLLCHAEIESYFEDIADHRITQALNSWRTNGRRSNSLVAVMAFCSSELSWQPNQNDAENQNKLRFDFRLSKVVAHFKKKLEGNHGIKSKNIIDMLIPIGVKYDQLDPTWLATMDSFGVKRGEFAHSSHQVQNQIDLVVERDNIKDNVLREIPAIDRIVLELA